MLPLELGDDNEDIRLAKDRMNMAYDAGLSLSSTVYDDPMKAAAATHLGKYTGEGAGKRGEKINALMWNGLLSDFIVKVGPDSPPSNGGLTEAEVKILIAETTLTP